MIKASTKFEYNLPKFLFKEDLHYVANRIFIPIMQQNITNQVTLDEKPLPPNQEKYTKAKVRKGLSPKVLIATGKLRSDFLALDRGKSKVIITLHPERKSIGGYLMDMGKNFFGVSTRMEENAVSYMKKRIKDAVKNASSRKK